MKIHIKELEYHKSEGWDASWLTLKISGEDVNVKMINALRRVATKNLPMYAFPPSLIQINTNTSAAFDNDKMIHRLSLLPLAGVDTGLYYLDEKYWQGVDFRDPERPVHPEEKHIEAYLNVVNTTTEILPVTTNDLRLYVNGEQIRPYSEEYPVLITKLRPRTDKRKGDEISVYMRAVMGCGDGESNVMWRGARNGYYHVENDGWIFTIESNWQCNEYVLLTRSCMWLKHRLGEIRNEIQERIGDAEIQDNGDGKVIQLIFNNEDHTIGEIINYEFQSHEDIIMSGMSKPDHNIKQIVITLKYHTTEKKLVKNLQSCIDHLIEKYDFIQKKLEKISK